MRRLLMLLVALGSLLPACSGLPVFQVVPDSPSLSVQKACGAIFPRGKWQLVHAIEAVLPGGGEKLVMGVTVVDVSARTLECALMTVEGLVLFQARLEGRVRVDRAVPPFDKEGFAQGLLDDLRLLFLPPVGAVIRTGRLPGETAACRYTGKEGGTIDVIPGRSWRLYRYSSRGRLARAVTAEETGGRECFPGRLTLRAPGPVGYTLVMKLVDAVRINN